MKDILKYTLDYLEKIVPDFKKEKKMGGLFTCPICNSFSCDFEGNNSYRMICPGCGDMGNLFDVIRKIKGQDLDDEELSIEIKSALELDLTLDKEISNVFDFFEKNNFDLVPITKEQKAPPIETDYHNKEHKDRKEWEFWYRDRLNFGIKTGEPSGISVLDFDTKEIPEEILNIKGEPLTQKSGRGWHYIYKYDSDLYTTKIEEYKMDILNGKKYLLCFPSIADDRKREFITSLELKPIPQELKDFLLKKVKGGPSKTSSDYDFEKIREDIKTEKFDLKQLPEGSRSDSLIRFGGILRKRFNLNDTSYVLNIFNRYFCNPPLPQHELKAMLGSLDNYISFDYKELAHRVLEYLRLVEECGSRDICDALGEKKKNIDEVLSHLIKEGYILKRGQGRGVYYRIIKKFEWKEEFMKEGKEIGFTMPYFDEIAQFRDGDMIIIGGKPKVGKSHIALNIVKRLIDQEIKPYYVCLESGNRFITIAEQLKIVEGEFKYCIHDNPEDIELEPDAVTIIDWILPNNYAETDKLFHSLNSQLIKNGGILIVFVQLMDSGEFFAKNMMKFFPSFVCRYFYNDEEGIEGHFKIDEIREKKSRGKKWNIGCKYDWDSRELKMIGELNIDKEGDGL